MTICAAEITMLAARGAVNSTGIQRNQNGLSSLTATARITAYASSSNAQTFDFQVLAILRTSRFRLVSPLSNFFLDQPNWRCFVTGHYFEGTGSSTLLFLELFCSGNFEDISLNHWLALTPPELVQAHVEIDDVTTAEAIEHRHRAQAFETAEVVGGVANKCDVATESILIKGIILGIEVSAGFSSATQKIRLGESKVVTACAEVDSTSG
ncbi:hypothetical protein J3R83DRAFT_7740 [Lanmaoa asiatica]|nr:hypothetical protein J3R83DRAFT_7740 [Lanmaoa asiatica]